jgi:PAS domain-containing protein
MRATEMQFHRLASSVAQLVWVVDASGRISYGNSSWYAHTGIGAGAKFVRNYLPLLHPEDRWGWERTWVHALASGEAYALECRLRFTAESNYAAKFTDEGGRISVLMEREPGWALVKVRDSGIFISPGMLERVFDAYVQAERGSAGSASGLGLGLALALALARHLIKLHGGTVNAFSEGLGGGSEFVVRLPAGNGRESPESRAQQ